MALFVSYKSQFLLTNTEGPTQIISFAVFLFFLAISLPATIQIKMTILLCIFTGFTPIPLKL